MNIALPDGSVKELAAGATVADVAASIGAGLAKAALAGKVDGTLVDLTATVTDGATVEIITAKSPEALHIMRHSCAHIMAEAVQELYPGTQISSFLTISPPTTSAPSRRRWPKSSRQTSLSCARS